MKIIKKLLCVAAFALVANATAAMAQVATVFELTGTATATAGAPQGAPAAPARSLRKGDNVNQGDTVATGAASSIVLRFEDGQVAALSANSRMNVAAYSYNKAEPAKSNVLLNLVEGGMRAITGLIGKARPAAVAYKAGNATIGIRGTDASFAVSGGNVVVTVLSGQIAFTFNGQTVTVPAGQGTSVLNGTQTPVEAAAAVIAAAMSNPTVAAALGQINTTALGAAVQSAATSATAAAQSTTGTQAGTPSSTPGSTGNTSSGSTGGAGGGGGSTLPPCTSISPISARVPGQNCTLG